MKIFAKFGEMILRLFDIIGMIILGIPKIPEKLRGINADNLRNRVDNESFKENIIKIKETGLEAGVSKISEIRNTKNSIENVKEVTVSESSLSGDFSSKEKERTVFTLQLTSLAFLVISIIYLFNFVSFIVYCALGIILVVYMAYVLHSKIKLMYPEDFNAYRDFFFNVCCRRYSTSLGR